MSEIIVADRLSLYLHIPFCGTRCTYCAFNTYTNAEVLIPAYVEAMCLELRDLGKRTHQPIHTVYFGGGTPSLLTPGQVEQIIHTCREAFDVLPDGEITMEMNPGSVDADYFSKLRTTGVNRISLGMQSAHSQELRLFARQHGPEAVTAAVQAARQAGFDNISLDLIYGVPHQTLAMWQQSVTGALDLRPDHLSMYALGLEDGTPMARWVKRGWLPAPDDDLAADMYELADEMARNAGLIQYEISNWTRPGMACRHNLQYWRNLPYLGVGAGAHGYAAGVRYQVVRPIQRYIDLVMQNQATPESLPFPLTSTVEFQERIDPATSMAEHMITGLRLLEEGIRLEAFRARYGVPLEQIYGNAMASMFDYDLLYRDGDRVKLTPRARLLSNQVFLQFV